MSVVNRTQKGVCSRDLVLYKKCICGFSRETPGNSVWAMSVRNNFVISLELALDEMSVTDII